VLAGNSGEAQEIWQLVLSQAYVSFPCVYDPIRVLHWRSREVHCPEAQAREVPLPQDVPKNS
jgi:hypothetical protein